MTVDGTCPESESSPERLLNTPSPPDFQFAANSSHIASVNSSGVPA